MKISNHIQQTLFDSLDDFILKIVEITLVSGVTVLDGQFEINEEDCFDWFIATRILTEQWLQLEDDEWLQLNDTSEFITIDKK